MADNTSSKDYDWAALCKKFNNPDNKPEEKPVAYEFSNGRKFLSPGEFGGVYAEDE